MLNLFPGYYADDQAGCQMFHVCDEILVSSFLCPVGSLFSQKLLTCDWWNKVDCSSAKKFYAINRNLYHQHDGDEMIRNAYVMVNLQPDKGLTTEPEERERQGKIVHYSRVDTPENDLPINYDDFSSNQDFRGFSPTFDEYSNQYKTNMNSKEEQNNHDHFLYSQEYQTHAPKMYPDSPIIRIHKIADDHLVYENRQKSSSKEQSSYRFTVSEFENEFQPSYVPTVPTVTATSRRFYSPTVPMSFRSSTLSYNKLDQNFDSSVHLYAQGKDSQPTSTPATIFRDDSRDQRNSTRDSSNYHESKQEVMKVSVNYNGREDNDNDRETYDQFYDDEQDKFEIMEGRESIGLAQSPSQRLKETTVQTPLVDETKTDSRKINNLNSTIQNNLDLQPANLEFKKEASNVQEVVRSLAFNSEKSENKNQDVQDYPTFTEATSFEQGYEDSTQIPKEENESKTEEIPVPDDHFDLNADISTTTSSLSDQNKHFVVEHQSNQGMIEKKTNDGFGSTLSPWKKTDNFSKEDHDDLKGHDDLLMSSTTSHPYTATPESLEPEEKIIFRLSPILQPPFEMFKPFHINVEELTPQAPTSETQPAFVPKHYQRYPDRPNHLNSTENTFQIKESPSDDENPNTTARSPIPNSSNRLKLSRFEGSEVNVPVTDIIPPLENQDDETGEFVPLLDAHLEQKNDSVHLINSSNPQINISVPSNHQEPPNLNHTNQEAQILSKYNPNLDFTIRSAIWNQPSISENKELNKSSTPIVENPFLNHRTISLALEPPNQTSPEKFEDELIFPSFQNVTPETELTPPLNTQTQNIGSSSQNEETTKFEEKAKLFEASTLKPEFPSSITEIEDTIEESNAPYQVTLTLNGNQDPESVAKDLIGKLVNQHEKGDFQGFKNFEGFEIAKSEEPSIPRDHEEPATVYTKTDFSSNPFLKHHFRLSTESTNYEQNSETHNRTEKNTEIRNQDSDVHRMSLLQLMSELAKANRLPRPFSPQESEILASEKPKTSKEPSRPISRTSTRFFANPFLNSAAGSSSPFITNPPSTVASNKEKRINLTLTSNSNLSNSVSSTENLFLRTEVILEQLVKNFGQPLYGSLREPLFELPQQGKEQLFDLPGEDRITDFKTGKAIVQKKSNQLNREAFTTQKPNFKEETEKTVVEMEFVPSLGFSFDTHEGREEYAQAVLQGLVTEEAVLKSEDKFSTSTQTFESDESTKNLKSNKNNE